MLERVSRSSRRPHSTLAIEGGQLDLLGQLHRGRRTGQLLNCRLDISDPPRFHARMAGINLGCFPIAHGDPGEQIGQLGSDPRIFIDQFGSQRIARRFDLVRPRVPRDQPLAGLVSRVTPVQTALRNCTRDEGGPFEVGNQVLISNHRKLLWSKATVVNVAEKPEQDFGRYD
jgi:hypothetical protein